MASSSVSAGLTFFPPKCICHFFPVSFSTVWILVIAHHRLGLFKSLLLCLVISSGNDTSRGSGLQAPLSGTDTVSVSGLMYFRWEARDVRLCDAGIVQRLQALPGWLMCDEVLSVSSPDAFCSNWWSSLTPTSLEAAALWCSESAGPLHSQLGRLCKGKSARQRVVPLRDSLYRKYRECSILSFYLSLTEWWIGS